MNRVWMGISLNLNICSLLKVCFTYYNNQDLHLNNGNSNIHSLYKSFTSK